MKLNLACTSPVGGWLLTVDCGVPFIGSFSSAPVGTKAVTQVFGVPRWKMQYLE